ncbi:MAG: hypothetical protein GWP06_17160 [Actinobacteria bacterium]|nr:hypothetical protein [Actinomycetota bacterium]
MLGISYALAGAFTIYAFLKFQSNRKKPGIAGMIGGLTLTGALYGGSCFLLGCCGSPMLAVYLGLFGPSFLGFTKPIILITTIFSLFIGFWWIEKKTKECSCVDKDNCK